MVNGWIGFPSGLTGFPPGSIKFPYHYLTAFSSITVRTGKQVACARMHDLVFRLRVLARGGEAGSLLFWSPVIVDVRFFGGAEGGRQEGVWLKR